MISAMNSLLLLCGSILITLAETSDFLTSSHVRTSIARTSSSIQGFSHTAIPTPWPSAVPTTTPTATKNSQYLSIVQYLNASSCAGNISTYYSYGLNICVPLTSSTNGAVAFMYAYSLSAVTVKLFASQTCDTAPLNATAMLMRSWDPQYETKCDTDGIKYVLTTEPFFPHFLGYLKTWSLPTSECTSGVYPVEASWPYKGSDASLCGQQALHYIWAGVSPYPPVEYSFNYSFATVQTYFAPSTPAPTSSPTVSFSKCPAFSGYGNHYCSFQVCGAVDVQLLTCLDAISSGGSQQQIYNSQMEVIVLKQLNEASCSTIEFSQWTSDCQWYNLQHYCFGGSGTCSGTTSITNGLADETLLLNEKFALLSMLITDLSDQPPISIFNWAIATDISQWQGITVNAQNRIIGINMSFFGANKLKGQLSDDLCWFVPYLESYEIKGNKQLGGMVPFYLESCSNLVYLDLSSNYLMGWVEAFPSSLKVIILNNNSLGGALPPLPPALQIFIVDNNGELSGNLSFPITTVLVCASSNMFTGTLPNSANLITYFDISDNSLTGTLPSGLMSIVSLFVGGNSLTGSIPEFQPTVLYFDGDSNNFIGTIPTLPSSMLMFSAADNMLTGSFPALPVNITALYVGKNLLAGSLPSLNETILQTLSLFSNSLSGTLPLLPSSMLYVAISNNQFTGNLSALSNELEAFYFADNLFHGKVPELSSNLIELVGDNNFLSGKLSQFPSLLEILSLRNNLISGSIVLNSVAVKVDLSYNRFTGSLPHFPVTMTSLVVGSNTLTGTIPAFLSNDIFVAQSNLEELDISNNPALSGLLPSSLCTWPSLYVVRATGCNISCYESCYPLTKYLDYMATYSMLDPDIVPAYDVCANDQLTALCLVNSDMGITDALTDDTVLYLAESVHVSVTPVFTIVNASDDFHAHYAYSDETPSFGNFKLSFDFRSLEAYDYDTFVRILCMDPSLARTWHNYTGMPGIGNNNAFSSSTCTSLEVFIYIRNTQLLTGTLATVAFSVERYSMELDWDCTDVASRSTNPCLWIGVECIQNSVVSSLSLTSLHLSGSVSSSIGSLTSLTSLDLSDNSLTGTLPTTVGLLTNLVDLDVSSNKLSGLPSELANLELLESLNLNTNDFAGKFPGYIARMTSLTSLQFRSNSFTGTFPQFFCHKSYTTLSVQDNKFECGSECGSFELGTCLSPTMAPTQLSTPSQLSTDGIVGIVVSVFFVAVGLVLFYRLWQRRRTYASLPELHKMLESNKRVELEHVHLHRSSLLHSDSAGRTYFSALVEKGQLASAVSLEALAKLIEYSLPIDPDDPEHRNDSTSPDRLDKFEKERIATWKLFIAQNHDLTFESLKIVLAVVLKKRSDEYINRLVHTVDSSGRKFIDVASSKARAELLKCTYLFRRFEIRVGPAEHKSATSMVVIATDHGNEKQQTHSADALDAPKNVVLKFMKYRHQFLSEQAVRRFGGFDEMFVITILDSFDGDDRCDAAQNFQKSAKKHGFGDYPYCLVMTLAQTNLHTVIDRRHITGKDWDSIKTIIKTLCNCLIHIHQKKIVHGDLKPNNLVLVDNAVRLIDFDASLYYGDNSTGFVGGKFSSGYLPPELFHEDGKCIKEFKVGTNGEMLGVMCIGGVAVHPVGYELVRPHPSQDMWAVGVILYLLCTGFQLFPTSVDGHAEKSQYKLIGNWTMETKSEKLKRIEDPLARNLASLLLNKDPLLRPDADHVLNHPFFSGIIPSRLQGEEAEYDVFISYRASADADLAEYLFNMLTTKYELRVWWDKVRLRPGQEWEQGFCEGLLKSRCFVCLFSKSAIFHPTNAACNFAELTEKSSCDNVLLEWRLALELRKRNLIEGIFPVMIGDRVGDVRDGQFEKKLPKRPTMPDVGVRSVEEKLCMHLEKQGLGCPLQNLTVKEVVQVVMANQGVFLTGDLTTAGAKVCTEIKKMNDAILELHEQRAATGGSHSPKKFPGSGGKSGPVEGAAVAHGAINFI